VCVDTFGFLFCSFGIYFEVGLVLSSPLVVGHPEPSWINNENICLPLGFVVLGRPWSGAYKMRRVSEKVRLRDRIGCFLTFGSARE